LGVILCVGGDMIGAAPAVHMRAVFREDWMISRAPGLTD
jgi:hypothetical protein